MKLRDIKISKQIRITQLVIVFIIIAISISSLISLNNIYINTATTHEHPLVVKDALASIKEDILNTRLLMEETVLLNDIGSIQILDETLVLLEKNTMKQVGIIEKTYLGPKSDIEYTKKLISEYNSMRQETLTLLSEGKINEAKQRVRFDGEFGLKASVIIDSINVMKDFATNKAKELYNDSFQQKNLSIVINFIFIIISIIISSIILTLLRRNLILPIKSIKNALDNFDQGNFQTTNLTVSKNELGMISNSFNLMSERIQKDTQEKIIKAAELLSAQNEISAQAELIKTQKAYYIDKQLHHATLTCIGDAVISCDINCNIIFINRVAEMLTEWKLEDAIGKHIEEVFIIAHETTGEKSENIVGKVILSGNAAELANHTVLISKSGIEIPIEDSAAPIFQEDGKIIGAVLVFRDVTDKRLKLRNIEYLSYHDELTGLYNRRFYEEEMKRINTERNLPLTLIMGDVNGLKLINDSLGHQYGDELLQKVANAIKKGCRYDDIIARLGGDEFIAILPKTDATEANVIINRIKKISSKSEVNCLPISISFGHGTKTNKDQDIHDIFRKAEDDMYRQKLCESASMRSKTVDLIMNTLYEKNQREMLHSKRVSEFCEACAKKMNFSNEQINQIRLAGLMHDIGKIGLDESLINKVEKITDDEFDEIKRHPEIGFRILTSVQEFSEIATFVLDHHERWDGKGYPKGIKGNDISIHGRIISLADSFDAMIRERTYKKTLSVDEAIIEIRSCSGTQFDPSMTETFIEVIMEQKNSI